MAASGPSAGPGVKTEEIDHILPDGTKLYMHKWIPAERPTLAKVYFIHGFSDHVHRYYDLFPTLARRGILVTGVDLRGWGRSSLVHPSHKGRTGPTSQTLADVAHIIETTQLPSPDIPLFVMGHSMGGNILLTLCSTPKYEDLVSQFAGIILEAPWIGVTAQEAPPALKVAVGRLAGKLLPNFQLTNAIAPEKTTHDPQVAKDVRADKLCHDTGTLEAFASVLDRAAALRNGTVKLTPKLRAIFVQHGNADYLIDYDVTKKWFDAQTSAIADREFRTYEGWNHFLHADYPGTREKYAKDVGDWILNRTPGAKEFIPEEERESVKVHKGSIGQDPTTSGFRHTVTEKDWKVQPGKAEDVTGSLEHLEKGQVEGAPKL